MLPLGLSAQHGLDCDVIGLSLPERFQGDVVFREGGLEVPSIAAEPIRHDLVHGLVDIPRFDLAAPFFEFVENQLLIDHPVESALLHFQNQGPGLRFVESLFLPQQLQLDFSAQGLVDLVGGDGRSVDPGRHRRHVSCIVRAAIIYARRIPFVGCLGAQGNRAVRLRRRQSGSSAREWRGIGRTGLGGGSQADSTDDTFRHLPVVCPGKIDRRIGRFPGETGRRSRGSNRRRGQNDRRGCTRWLGFRQSITAADE